MRQTFRARWKTSPAHRSHKTALSLHQKALHQQKSPIFPQRSPIILQESPVFPPKQLLAQAHTTLYFYHPILARSPISEYNISAHINSNSHHPSFERIPKFLHTSPEIRSASSLRNPWYLIFSLFSCKRALYFRQTAVNFRTAHGRLSPHTHMLWLSSRSHKILLIFPKQSPIFPQKSSVYQQKSSLLLQRTRLRRAL